MELVTQKQLDEAKAKWTSAHREFSALSDTHFRQTILPEMRRRIGRCYRYRNSSGPGEIWWMYLRIVAVADETYRSIEVGKRPGGRIEISVDKQYGGCLPDLMQGFEQMPATKFRAEVKKILGEVQAAAMFKSK